MDFSKTKKKKKKKKDLDELVGEELERRQEIKDEGIYSPLSYMFYCNRIPDHLMSGKAESANDGAKKVRG